MPLSIEEAVIRSRDVLAVFVKNSVECIRIGLCESDNLHSEETFFAGPNHPSLGEMVKSALYLKKIEDCLTDQKGNPRKNRIRFSVSLQIRRKGSPNSLT